MVTLHRLRLHVIHHNVHLVLIVIQILMRVHLVRQVINIMRIQMSGFLVSTFGVVLFVQPALFLLMPVQVDAPHVHLELFLSSPVQRVVLVVLLELSPIPQAKAVVYHAHLVKAEPIYPADALLLQTLDVRHAQIFQIVL